MALETAYDSCADILRTHDRDRYLASLFAPSEIRPHLHALQAFDIEIARIPALVSEAMPGEIRLQWWRDMLTGLSHGDVASAPVAAALRATCERFALPHAPLVRLTEARIFDLYDDRMPDMAALEAYAGETDATILQLGATILAGQAVPELADVSGHGGVAMAILRALQRFSASGYRDARLVPTALAENHGLVIDLSEPEVMPGLAAVWDALCEAGLEHLEKAKAAATAAPAECAPLFLPLGLVEHDLMRLQKQGPSPLKDGTGPWQAVSRQWRLWRLARAGGFGSGQV